MTPCNNAELCIQAVSSGNLAIYEMTFKTVGAMNEGHAHTFNHFTLVGSGRVLIESNNRSVEVGQGGKIWIPRGVAHRMTALEAWSIVWCIHAVHKKDDPGDVLDDAIIPPGTPDWLLAVPLLQGQAKREGIVILESGG